MCASRLICHAFRHDPIFRIGADEFNTILRGNDFAHRDELVERFCELQDETARPESKPRRQVRVSLGIAVHDSATDASVTYTMRRADKTMYENKERRKAKARTPQPHARAHLAVRRAPAPPDVSATTPLVE